MLREGELMRSNGWKGGLIAGLWFVLAGSSQMTAAFTWTTDEPSNHGMCKSGTPVSGCTTTLDAVKNSIDNEYGTTRFVVIRNDKVIYQWHSGTRTAATLLKGASVAKALIGGTAMTYAVGFCGLSENKKATDYFRGPRAGGGNWDSGNCALMTIDHLASHTSSMQAARGHLKDQTWN